MQGIQYILPAQAYPYAKFIVALVLAIGASITEVTDAPSWVTVVLAVAGAVGTFLQANSPAPVDTKTEEV